MKGIKMTGTIDYNQELDKYVMNLGGLDFIEDAEFGPIDASTDSHLIAGLFSWNRKFDSIDHVSLIEIP